MELLQKMTAIPIATEAIIDMVKANMGVTIMAFIKKKVKDAFFP